MKPHNPEQLTLAKCYYAIFGLRLDSEGFLKDLKTGELKGEHDSLEFVWYDNEAHVTIKTSIKESLSNLNFNVETLL